MRILGCKLGVFFVFELVVCFCFFWRGARSERAVVPFFREA